MADRVEILLVEDTPSDIRLTQEALKDSKLNYNLSVVHDGEEAMEYFRKNAGTPQQPGLVLLDLNMPRMNGHEVLAQLKQIKEYQETPVVLLTVSRDEDEIMKALSLKMNYYLGKPVTSDQLNTLIEAIFELQQEKPSKHHLQGEDAHIRYVLAGNPHTTLAVLEKLAMEDNPHIRARVAENPNTPKDLLMKLATDPNSDVRLGVAENPKAPIDLLEKLANDKNDDVRLGIASNPSVPEHILKKLSADQQPHVVAQANNTLARTGMPR